MNNNRKKNPHFLKSMYFNEINICFFYLYLRFVWMLATISLMLRLRSHWSVMLLTPSMMLTACDTLLLAITISSSSSSSPIPTAIYIFKEKINIIICGSKGGGVGGYRLQPHPNSPGKFKLIKFTKKKATRP